MNQSKAEGLRRREVDSLLVRRQRQENPEGFWRKEKYSSKATDSRFLLSKGGRKNISVSGQWDVAYVCGGEYRTIIHEE